MSDGTTEAATWLVDAFERAQAGKGQVVVVEGAPDPAFEEVAMKAGTVLRGHAVPGDVDISFGTLDQVLAGLGQPGVGPAAHQGRISDPFDVACVAFDAITTAAASGTVIVRIDGIEHVDRPSVDAFAMVMRLLGDEPVLVVAAGGGPGLATISAQWGDGVVHKGTAPLPSRTSAAAIDPEFAAIRERRAAVTDKYDDALAKDAIALAERLLRRGAYPEAVWLYSTASDLTMLPFAKQQLRLRAASIALTGGNVAQADALAGDDDTLDQSALGCLVKARRAFLEFDFDTAEIWFLRAWDQVDQKLDKTVARLTASGLAEVQAARLRPAAGWARRAVELFDETALVRGNDPVSQLCIALAFEARMREAAEFVERKADLFVEIEPGITIGQAGRGQNRLWRDELLDARADLIASSTALRRLGPPSTWMTTALYLGDCDTRIGNWDNVIANGVFMSHAGHGLGIPDCQGLGDMLPGWILAARGDFERAEELLAPFPGAFTPAYLASSTVGRARLAHARGDWSTVIATLAPLNAFKEVGLGNPALLQWRDWLADGYLGAGDVEGARSEIEQLAERAAVVDMRSVNATLGRLQGRLAEADGDAAAARAHFAAAAEHALSLPMPFLQALVASDQGAFLARQGAADEARPILEAALQWLTALEARPYAQRVVDALASIGVTAELPAPDPIRSLDPLEQSVAWMHRRGLARGLITRRLLISPRRLDEALQLVEATR